ncbi:hypothetical protein AOLI_G00148060 [Acnodon oligacanthus]
MEFQHLSSREKGAPQHTKRTCKGSSTPPKKSVDIYYHPLRSSTATAVSEGQTGLKKTAHTQGTECLN